MDSNEIRELRMKMKLSQEGFGALLGVSWTTIYRWESGKSKPSRLANDKLKQIIQFQPLEVL